MKRLKQITIESIRAVVQIFEKKTDVIAAPTLLDIPPAQNILVLAPHFDDATIGCGGTIRKHVLAGNIISVVYVTDGREGIPDEKDKEKVVTIRREEAKRAMKVLGVEDINYLSEIDATKGIKEESIHKLYNIIVQREPDLIYLPWFLDNHTDHVKTNTLLRQVYTRSKKKFHICAYEVWTPLIPNIIVDIGGLIENKKKALSCFTSQCEKFDYLSTVVGLNKYRSCYSQQGRSFAEVFLYMKADEYFSLTEKMPLGPRL